MSDQAAPASDESLTTNSLLLRLGPLLVAMFCGFLTIGVPLPGAAASRSRHARFRDRDGRPRDRHPVLRHDPDATGRGPHGRSGRRQGDPRSRPRDLRRCWRRLSPVPHARAALDGPRGAVGRSPRARGRRKPADHGRSQLGHHPRRHGTLRSRHGLERHGPIFGPGRRSATRLRAVPGLWVRRGGVERDTASRLWRSS